VLKGNLGISKNTGTYFLWDFFPDSDRDPSHVARVRLRQLRLVVQHLEYNERLTSNVLGCGTVYHTVSPAIHDPSMHTE